MSFCYSSLLECPHCTQMQYASYFGGGVITSYLDRYTDGRRKNSLLSPWFMDFGKCSHCKGYFWTEREEKKFEVQKKIMSWEERKKIRDETVNNSARLLTNLTSSELLEVVQSELISNEEEEYLARRWLWWSQHEEKTTDSDLHDTNAKRLLALGKKRENTIENTLMQAELHRNLGEFDACLTLLQDIQDTERMIYIETIRAFALQKKTETEKINVQK